MNPTAASGISASSCWLGWRWVCMRPRWRCASGWATKAPFARRSSPSQLPGLFCARPTDGWRCFYLARCWLPPLPIALGDSGPHIAVLFAAAGLLVGLLRIHEWRFRADFLATTLLTLSAIFLASVSMAAIYSGPVVAAASLARVVLFGISVYTFLYVRDGPGALNQRQSLRAIRWLFWAASLSALFACVDFYFQFPAPAGYAQQFIWIESGVFRRAQGVFYEASTLGNLCAFFLEMIAVALFRPREAQPISRPAMFAGGVSLGGALVLSYSRASLLNLAVALMVLVWLHRDRIRWRRLLAGTAIFFAGAAALLSFAFPVFTGGLLAAGSGGVRIFLGSSEPGDVRAPGKLAHAGEFHRG